MKKITTVIRLLLGVLILFSGANKFGHWVDVAYMHDAMAWVMNLSHIGAGFIIYVIAVVEIVVGIALLVNKFVTLASMVLFPLMVSIIIFHFALDIKGIAIALIVFAMNVYILIEKKEKISGIFQPNS